MRSIGRQGLAALVVLTLPASCLDSGHLLGNARGTGGQSSAGAGGAASTGGSNGSGGGVGTGGAPGTGGITGSGGTSSAGGSGGSGSGGRASTGGTVGTGGVTSTGGSNGSGGSVATGGAVGTGGVTSTGGSNGSGGSVGSGGAAGTGGAGGTTGGNVACGGPSGATCPTGQFCDLASNCGMLAGASGLCMPFGGNVTCSDQATPVCGCEGKTYPNDCQRAAAGMLKAMDGVCADGGFSYPSAYLSWQSFTGTTGSGPATAVNAPDWLMTWDTVAPFPPESPPANPTGMNPLSITDTDDLFLRLAGVNVWVLPHGPSTTADCHGTLYFRLCRGCAANTLTYGSADQIGPEMELIWSWFDQRVGATAMTNPRNYCSP